MARTSQKSGRSVRFQNSDLKEESGAPYSVKRDDESGANFDIKVYSRGGKQSESFQVYRDIDRLNKETLSEEAQAYSMQ